MISEYSLSSNTSFKKHLDAKSLKIFWEYCSSCAKHDVAASVSVTRVTWTYKCDVNSVLSEKSKEPSPSLMSAEASFDDNSIKEALNVTRILSVITENKMGCRLCSNITRPNPTEGIMENIGEGLH